MDERDFVIPAYEVLDPEQMEVFLDVDLDELTVLFYGRSRRSYAHPVNEVLSYLLDDETDEVVGVSFSRFMLRVVTERPEIRELIPMATILMEDFAGSLDELLPQETTDQSRLRGAFAAAVHAWREHERPESLENIMRSVAAYA